jgi:hypothetical protein
VPDDRDRDRDREGERGKHPRIEQSKDSTGAAARRLTSEEHQERVKQIDRHDAQQRHVHEPFELLALAAAGPTQAHHQRRQRTEEAHEHQRAAQHLQQPKDRFQGRQGEGVRVPGSIRQDPQVERPGHEGEAGPGHH